MDKYNTNALYFVRFIAAFSILAFHFFPADLQSKYHFRNLDEAVNFFFFISGFVMVVSNKAYFTNKANPSSFLRKDFWAKRFARIYPSYFLALLLVVLFNYTVNSIYPSIPQKSIFEVLGIQRWLYGGSINFPAWTISTEFLFYLLFPYTVNWLSKNSVSKIATVVIILFVINVIIISFIGFTFVVKQHTKSGLFILGTIYRHPIFEYTVFLFGNLCGVFFLKKNAFQPQPNRHNILLCITSLFIILATIYFASPQNPLLAAGILSPIYFVFVVSLCNMQGVVPKMLSSKFFIFLGDISFSMYIFQIPLFLFFGYLTGGDYLNLAFKDIPGFIVFVTVLIAFCSLNYVIYEVPLKNVILKLHNDSKPKKIASIRKLANNSIS